ncbi:MAG: hypothetical protein H6577_05750 [Lewinellaceae bacterium]|nr:hypothetical protein [Saprospiraceae bacterium]MCB9337610.1 hypothetical protein [Lewinellaceae bacterium]
MEPFKDVSSGLQFVFSDSWSDVIQFDEHPDVIKHANGLSCIDFAGVFSGKKLVLIEAKNFKNRPSHQHHSIIERLGSKGVSPLADEIAVNMKDFVVFVTYLVQKAKTENGVFWDQMKANLFEKDITCVLWLETDLVYDGMPRGRVLAARATTEDNLKRKLKWLTEKGNVFIASQSGPESFIDNLHVSFLKS